MNKALTLAIVAAAVSAGTYFGLSAVAPQKHHDEAQVATGPSVDDVFSGTLNLATGDAPVAEVPSEDPALAPGPAPGEVADDGGEAGVDEASGETAPADSAAAESAEGVGTPVAENTNTDIAEAAPAEPAPAETPPPAAEEKPAPAPKPAPKAEPKPAPAKADSAAKPAAPASKPEKAVSNWWGNADSPDKLSLSYAGSAAYRTAIVLIFNRAFESADSANTNIKVTDAAGKTVSGQWELNGNNRAMLVFPIQKTGRYTVSIKGGLTDLGKSTLGKPLKGPVTVK